MFSNSIKTAYTILNIWTLDIRNYLTSTWHYLTLFQTPPPLAFFQITFLRVLYIQVRIIEKIEDGTKS